MKVPAEYLRCGILLLAVAQAACQADRLPTDPGHSQLDEDVLFVSEIVRLPASAGLQASAISADVIEGDVTYVSLAPGTVPGGTEARLRNRASGIGTTVPISDGGFDPIALPAQKGDTIDVTVRDNRGSSFEFNSIVVERRPVVVRTSPTRGETDVGARFVVLVVFSEPMRATTITGQTLLLLKGDQTVPAAVQLRQDGIEAQLTPQDVLEPGTTYTIVVTTGVTDLEGASLSEEVRVDFTTSQFPPSAVVGISPGVDTLEAGSRLQVSLTVWDANTGVAVEGIPVRWRSSDPSIARVDAAGHVQSVEAGDVVIFADVTGVGGFPSRLTFTPLSFVAVTAGITHTCGLSSTGDAFCWGANDHGQLGTGDHTSSLVPTPVTGGQRFTALVAGGEHTCGLATQGQTFCWGSDGGWQLGRLDRQAPDQATERLTPVALPGSPAFSTLTAGGAHGCGVATSGIAACWGEYAYPVGRLLLDGPETVAGRSDFVVIASGASHDCSLVAGGTAWCWGRNDQGQLGDGTLTSHPTLSDLVDTTTNIRPGAVAGTRTYQRIAAGGRHTCALSDGVGYCWGDDSFGQLGNGQFSSAPSNKPARIASGLEFSTLSAGDSYSCAVASGGIGYCWGRNDSGQLGDGSRQHRSTPVAIASGLAFTSIATGAEHTCGVTTTGVLYCWGKGENGELGNGYTGVYDQPVKVSLQR
jgi:alpha-tubulin suppressor-like RCC1 family protein